jgi:asparagine synthase (glutamine-hydrolysing)
MCGIAGKTSAHRDIDRSLIERMCGAIEHRGPDSRGVYLDSGVGLGVQRLRVIDLNTGDQPIFNEDRSLVVILNGEIYNYKELRADLARRGHVFRTQGDTEVIAHLYEDHGADCVTFLRGMFAFAVWDTREKQLFLARDRLGKKPLVYAYRNGDFWFASEIRALLEDSEIDRSVDLDAIDSFLHFQYVPAPLTAFSTIKKLPPAHTLVWRDGEMQVQRYWKLSYARRAAPIANEEAQEEIRSRILDATRLRLRSDVPLGAFLSGGIDSSAVVAAMAMQSSTPVRTFSIGFDVGYFDETSHAREVANLYGTDHQEFRVEPEAIEILPLLVWHFGEPFADNSAIPTFYLSKMSRRHVTVALNGDGGDENFGGYQRYLSARFADRLARRPRIAQELVRALAAVLGQGHGHRDIRRRLSSETRAAFMEPYERYAWRMAFFTAAERRKLYTRDFHEHVNQSVAAEVIRAPFVGSDAADDVNRLLDVDVQTYLPNALLVKMDITSMAHSLEVRSPLLDHELMEFVASLPGALKVQGGTTKKIMRDALTAWLPESILSREKWGFGAPIGHWFRAELRDLPGEILLDPRSRDRGWFREEEVRSLITEHQNGQRDNANKIWALIQLELWLRTFVDTRSSAPIAAALV